MENWTLREQRLNTHTLTHTHSRTHTHTQTNPHASCDGRLQEKRLSGLSNQSHDSQASNSTASANSHEERRGLIPTGE